MKNNITSNLRYLLLTALAAGLTPAQTPGGPVCKIVFDAGKQLNATPHHVYEVETSSLGKQSSEQISTQGSIYVTVGGRWRKSPMNMQQVQKQEDENIRNARNASCHYLRDESVGGQPAEVYSAHSETTGVISDTVVWLAKGSRRVLREEEDVNAGGEKMHWSIRVDYTNVAAPASE